MAAFTVALVCLPACGRPPPAPGDRYLIAGAAAEGGSIRFPVVHRGRGSADDRVYVVTCPADGPGRVEASNCWWQHVGDHNQHPAASSGAPPRSLAARASAGIDNDCALDEVTVQSNGTRDGVEGYWLLVCGQQLFYQWSDAEGRFVSRGSRGAQ